MTTIADEMVERFKEAWHEADEAGLSGDPARAGLGAALEVVAAVTPQVPSAVREKLAEVIEDAEDEWLGKFDRNVKNPSVNRDPGPQLDFVADAVTEWLEGGAL